MKNLFYILLATSIFFSACSSQSEADRVDAELAKIEAELAELDAATIPSKDIDTTPKITVPIEITRVEKLEDHHKAQLRIRCYLKDGKFNEEYVKNSLDVLYEKYKNEGNFKNYVFPDYVIFFLFENKKDAIKDVWIKYIYRRQRGDIAETQINELPTKR